jgi:Tol biopolymer transport system component
VTVGPLANTQACYGPEGRLAVSVVDIRSKRATAHIALSGPGGRKPLRRISAGPADHSPACAPDGSAVVFVRQDRKGRETLWIRSPVLNGETRLLGPGREPSFSRDGRWLTFSAKVGRSWRIWRMRADGTGRARIGNYRSGRGLREESTPTISPDGRYVVYTSSEAPPRVHLYVRRLDGSGDRILFADGDAEFPIW